MLSLEEYSRLDATAMAALVEEKEVTPLELVQTAIKALEKVNPRLNAVITPLFDQALASAEGVKPGAGPLAGVPFLLKDLLASLEGAPMSLGSRSMLGYRPDHDSELVRRLKASGLIIMGKTNTPEFGLLPTTEPLAHGATRNPYDTKRTTGGSSGGSAAAVAAGVTPAAHAGDGGGSIRIPASCCGLFGLKPTRARNPLGPDFGDISSGLVVEHVVSRTVRDSALILDVTSGPDLGDPYFAPPPGQTFTRLANQPPPLMKIGFTVRAARGFPVHEDCQAAVLDTARLLEDMGHEVIEADFDYDAAMVGHCFNVLWAAGLVSTVDAIVAMKRIKPSEDFFEPLTLYLYEKGKGYSAADYVNAVTWLQRFSRQVAKTQADYDVFMSPTLAEPPPLLGELSGQGPDPAKAWTRAAMFSPFTPLANITGRPAMSVPLHFNEQGLPIGVHFMARSGWEGRLLSLASALEEARPWAARLPPVSILGAEA